jgi:hypothetical protein
MAEHDAETVRYTQTLPNDDTLVCYYTHRGSLRGTVYCVQYTPHGERETTGVNAMARYRVLHQLYQRQIELALRERS